MRSLLRVALCGTVISLSAGALAQTPAEIFKEMDSRKRASLEGIDSYSEMKTMMGMCTLEHFEKETTASADGRGTVEYMRLVPISEVLERRSPDSPIAQASAQDLNNAANELRAVGPDLDREIQAEMGKVGLPGGLGHMLMNPPPGKPWLSPKPGDLMSNYAMMLDGVAAGKRENARIAAEAKTEAQTDPLAAAAERTRVVGREQLRDRPAIHLVAENLGYTQAVEGSQFTLDKLHLWVDAERYVPLKMQMEGAAVEGSQTRKLRIERENMAYRKVDGCLAMYEPQRSVMRIAGILSRKEQADMEEAQQKLAQMESQLAALPPAQHDLIMRRMGPQLEMLKNMAAGNGIEMVSLTVGMRCNADLPSVEEYMQTAPGVSQGACIGFVGEAASP
jgi:hypothetical protein